ncbi:unnamed protein product [Schistosoma curassoni]|uniref:Secreted protein n=1 Tax=Schistosoma curassoni TaxID=6186 RepID=A0A183JBQ4_9TREM|nr:unnamed protein product [Schistosoma curassoni]
MFFNCRNAVFALPIPVFTSASGPPCSSMMLPSASADVLSGSGAFSLLICPMIILISPIIGEVTTIARSMGAAVMSGGFTGAGLFNKSLRCPAHLFCCFRIPVTGLHSLW